MQTILDCSWKSGNVPERGVVTVLVEIGHSYMLGTTYRAESPS